MTNLHCQYYTMFKIHFEQNYVKIHIHLNVISPYLMQMLKGQNYFSDVYLDLAFGEVLALVKVRKKFSATNVV